MALPRGYRRHLQKEHDKSVSFFGNVLMGFYEFLEKSPKPSDNEVREEFIKRDRSWRHYCSTHNLNDKAKVLFKQEVSVAWKNRYTKNS